MRFAASRLRQEITAAHTAIGLQVLDRWPRRASHRSAWKSLGVDRAFALRWESLPPPPEVARWHQRFDRLAYTGPVRAVRSWRSAQLSNDFTPHPRLVNVGLGPRHKNSFHAAVAADVYLAGHPATALPWAGAEDPIIAVAVEDAIPGTRQVVFVANEEETRKRAAAWGPGAKGIVSVRDPQHPTHRVFNVISRGSTSADVEFVDYSDPRQDPHEAAHNHFGRIDEHSGFASIRLWQTSDLPDARRLPHDVFADPQAAESRRSVIEQLPESMPEAAQLHAVNRILFIGDHAFANWLLTQIDRGACTFDAAQLARLHLDWSRLEPLTGIDSALLDLAATGSIGHATDRIEITIADTRRTRRNLAMLGHASDHQTLGIRSDPLDGLRDDTIEVVLDRSTLDRVGVEPAHYQPPAQLGSNASQLVPARDHSWVDANRGRGEGSRKTNCWNTAAAVAGYLSTGAPSMSLPISRAAPFRPTIPEYLRMVQATASPVFVSGQIEAEDVVASWGPAHHGLVLAAWSEISTHVFNVVHDGRAIRFLDGHTAEEGDFNFDVHWQRIGIVPVGPLHASLHAAQDPVKI